MIQGYRAAISEIILGDSRVSVMINIFLVDDARISGQHWGLAGGLLSMLGQTYKYIYICTYICIYTCTYTHIYIDVYVHIYRCMSQRFQECKRQALRSQRTINARI